MTLLPAFVVEPKPTIQAGGFKKKLFVTRNEVAQANAMKHLIMTHLDRVMSEVGTPLKFDDTTPWTVIFCHEQTVAGVNYLYKIKVKQPPFPRQQWFIHARIFHQSWSNTRQL